ncbi:MAG: AbrB/MazE/SpoVT family DNA-binding domain-containing protein [Janthinobacterium lividum]
MPIARLKKLGGSVALTIPAPVAREVNFEIDMDVNISVENGALVIRHAKKRRTLAEFLAQCDLTAPACAELAGFDAGPRSGDELI